MKRLWRWLVEPVTVQQPRLLLIVTLVLQVALVVILLAGAPA